MNDRDLSTINVSGELGGIQLGDITSPKKVLTQDTIDAKIKVVDDKAANNSAAISINAGNISGLKDGSVEVDGTHYNAALANPPHTEGKVFYDKDKHNMSYYTDIPGVTLNNNTETVIRVVNRSGGVLLNGSAVRYDTIDGATGLPAAVAAIATSFINAKVVGAPTHDIADGAEGWVTIFGTVGGVIPTAVMEAGQIMVVGERLFLSETEAGKYTHTPPDIATAVGGFFTGDVLFTHPTTNINLPNIGAFMQGQNDPIYPLKITPFIINDYALVENVVMAANPLNGAIDIVVNGAYDVNVLATFSFPSTNNVRTIWVGIFDVTTASLLFKYPIQVGKDEPEAACSFGFPVKIDTPREIFLELSASSNMEVVLNDVSFEVKSSHIR